jgi:hypothetical protein
LHGAVDGNAHRSRAPVDPAVRIEVGLLGSAERCQIYRPLNFQSRLGKFRGGRDWKDCLAAGFGRLVHPEVMHHSPDNEENDYAREEQQSGNGNQR